MLQFQSVLDEADDPEKGSDKDVVSIQDVASAYKEQLKKSKNRADIYYKYGILLLSEENMKAATEAFEKAASLNRLNYRAQHHLAVCHFDSNKPEQSLETLISDELSGAGIYQDYYQLTLLYTDRKAFAKAIRKLSIAKPTEIRENTEVQANLEDILGSLGMVERSYTSWKRINETSEYLQEVFDKDSMHNKMNF